MKKSHLIHTFSPLHMTLSPLDKKNMINAIFDWFAQTLEKGHSIELREFGNFHLRIRSARQAINPKTGSALHIAKRIFPFFRAGKKMKDLLNDEKWLHSLNFEEPSLTVSPNDLL